MLRTLKKFFVLFLLFFLCSSALIYAQIPEKEDSTLLEEINFEEIVISASKAETKYNNFPASVAILDKAIIRDEAIETLSDLSGKVANLQMANYGSKLTSPVYIRGVGSRLNSPSVGLYVDGVPYFSKAAFAFDFFDIKQIEVLRGPQGTLFGRNTMGGVINILSLSPWDYKGLNINTLIGSSGTYKINTGYYGKIQKKFAYSLTGNYRYNTGYYTNTFNDQKVDKLNSFGLRNRLIYKISDNLKLENTAAYENSKEGGYPYASQNPQNHESNPINFNEKSGYDRLLFSDAFVFNFNTKKLKFKAITSGQILKDLQKIDQDLSPQSLFFAEQKQKQYTISQEVIARSYTDKKYKWLCGAFAFTEYADKDVDISMRQKDFTLSQKYNFITRGLAIFHQSTFDDLIIRGLSLSAGIRFDQERHILHYQKNKKQNDNIFSIVDTIYPSQKYLQYLPKVSLQYKFDKNKIYASFSKGYKTGGYNSPAERPEDLTFHPEYSWNYEFGLSSSVLKEKLHLKFSLFYIDWKDQQVYRPVPSGRGSMLKNAGHSISKGFECFIRSVFFKSLILQTSYGYTNAVFKEYKKSEQENFSGKKIPFVPESSLSVKLLQNIQIKDSNLIDKITLALHYKGIGDIYWNPANTAKQHFYHLLEGRISFTKQNVKFGIWAKNLLNSKYYLHYFEALGNQFFQSERPMEFGMNISAKF